MKTVVLLPFLSLLASSSALPADLQDRAPFSFPALPGLPALPSLPLFGIGSKTSTTTTPAQTTLATTTKATVPTTTKVTTTTTPKATTTAGPTTTAKTTSSTSSTTVAGSACTPSGSSGTGGSTEDGVLNCECKEVTVIFARGTTETGNVGTVAGPPMFSALRQQLGSSKVAVQGVAYPATAAGNANGGADGGPLMASLVKQALSQCPSTKIALSGYSQGGMVVHNAVAQQGLSASQIAAVVLFGDPFNGQSVGSVPSSEVLEFCANGDDVCNGSGTYAITSAHMTYGSNATAAANFIIKTANLS